MVGEVAKVVVHHRPSSFYILIGGPLSVFWKIKCSKILFLRFVYDSNLLEIDDSEKKNKKKYREPVFFSIFVFFCRFPFNFGPILAINLTFCTHMTILNYSKSCHMIYMYFYTILLILGSYTLIFPAIFNEFWSFLGLF
jgi:hypothetical protein